MFFSLSFGNMLCVCIAHEAGGRKESNNKKLPSIYASLNYLKIKFVLQSSKLYHTA